MGTTLTSLHIYTDKPLVDCPLPFRSFSDHWLTCTAELGAMEPTDLWKIARNLSRQSDTAVLLFDVFDSESISFLLFRDGRAHSRYTDSGLSANKKLYDIPGLVGLGDGHKKRLSSILACPDTEHKVAMLEEYLGVCLLFVPELMNEPGMLRREQGDALYQEYRRAEKANSGKAEPYNLELLTKAPGKLFFDTFGTGHLHLMRPHCFLYGYTNDESHDLYPFRFTGTALLQISPEEFYETPTRDRYQNDPRFKIKYGYPDTVTFSADCPEAFRNKTLPLPGAYFPHEFTPTGELLLSGMHRICLMDNEGKIVFRHSIKGDVTDVLDNYLLTTTGDSFCGYCYQPNAAVHIYRLSRQD